MNAQLATLKDKEPQQILDSVQKNMEAVAPVVGSRPVAPLCGGDHR